MSSHPQIAAPVSDLQDQLAGATALSDRASRAVQWLPSMLGDHGPRTYLFLVPEQRGAPVDRGHPGRLRNDHRRDGAR